MSRSALTFAVLTALTAAAAPDLKPAVIRPAVDASVHARGPKDAKHLLVVYTEFECSFYTNSEPSFCARGARTDAALAEKYGRDLRIVVKMMPLEKMHPFALPAARFFEAAMLQSEDKAWAFHDHLFETTSRLSDHLLEKTAKDVGLDLSRLEKDAAGPEVDRRLTVAADEFKALGLTGVPSSVADGIIVQGAYPPQTFIDIFERPVPEPKAAAPEKPWWADAPAAKP